MIPFESLTEAQWNALELLLPCYIKMSWDHLPAEVIVKEVFSSEEGLATVAEKHQVIVGLLFYPQSVEIFVTAYTKKKFFLMPLSGFDSETLIDLGALPWGTHICRKCGDFTATYNGYEWCPDCLLKDKLEREAAKEVRRRVA